MNRKGIVSSIDNINKKARVIIPDMNNILTPEIQVISSVGELNIGDVVLISFWNTSLADGAVIAELR